MRFAQAPPEPWFTVSICALILLAAWSYRRLWPAQKHAAMALAFLRALVLAGILLALYRPMRDEAIADPSGRRLLVLYDASASMGIPGADGRPRSAPLRAAVSDFARKWADGGEVTLLAFDGICRPVRDLGLGDVADTGTKTDLAGALLAAHGAMGGTPPSAVLLVTDGVSNQPGDLVTAVDRMKAPLFVLAPDSGDPGARILSFVAPSAVSIGGKIDIECRIAGVGSLALALYRVNGNNEELIEKRTVSAGDHRFSVPARSAGAAILRVRVEGRDSYAADNVRTAAVTVLPPRDVLFVAGRLSWEYKYIRAALESQEAPKINVVAFDDTRAVYVAGDGRNFVRPRDWNAEMLAPIAVLVVLDADAVTIPQSAVPVLREMAAQGRLGIAASGRSLDASSPVASLLPLRSIDAAANSTANSAALVIDAPGHALARSAGALTPGDGARTLTPAADAVSIARYATGGPAVLVGRSGTSRAVMVGFETWKTSWLAGDSKTVRTFWRDVIEYLSPPPVATLKLVAPRKPILPGEEAVIEIRGETTISSATVELEGAGLSERKARDKITSIRVTPRKEGECRITVTTGRDSDPTATAYLECVERAAEYDGPDSDLALLAALSKRSGGRMLDPGDLSPVSAAAATRSTVIRRRSVDLWDRPILLLLLAGALATEWGLRRRLGLR